MPPPILHTITSLDLPALAPYRSLRFAGERAGEAQGHFIAEGPEVVSRLLQSQLRVASLLCTPEWRARMASRIDEHAARESASAAPLTVFLADDALLDALVGFHVFRGVMACAHVPASASIESLLTCPSPRLLVALDGLTNAENVGAIARSAAAFGVQGLILGETCCPPWTRRAARTSMGALFGLRVRTSSDLAADLRALRAAGVTCLATDPRDAVPLAAADLCGDVCLVMGSEGHGVSPAVRAACSSAVGIPQASGFESLNVAAAAAICFYECICQRDVALRH